MAKEFITNGGNIIRQDHNGYSINGQRVNPKMVQAQIKQDGGRVHDMSNTDRKTKAFFEQQRNSMRNMGRNI